jgi:hypothetical protein
MAEEAKTAPEVVAKETETAKAEAVTETAKVEVKKEATVGEILGSVEKEPRLVPESALIEFKKQNKEMSKELKELKQQIAEGATKKEVSSSIDEIATKYNVDKGFLSELASAMKGVSREDIESEISSKFKPLEEKQKEKEIGKLFKETFAKILEESPEYKGVVNEEVIKALALDPKNQNKSFNKIIEEAYGHLIPGRKTMETTTPGGGKVDGEIDFNRAKTDVEYFKQIMANPTSKAKYNSELQVRLKL